MTCHCAAAWPTLPSTTIEPMSSIRRWLPFLAWPRPDAALLRGETNAAITVALVMIPQSVAYASLAAASIGLQPLASAQVQGFLAALPRLAGLADVRELLPLLLAPA